MNELRDPRPHRGRKVVVGQDEAVDLLLSAVVLGGHVLLQGVPGVAKSLLANAFARTVGGSYRRVQFTPDMLPSDLTGTMTLRGGELALPPRAGVHERAARRRDQPHSAEDAIGAARGNAGAPGLGRRDRAPAAGSVPRRRHSEPDRVRRHLPAARGAARSLSRSGRGRLPGRAAGARGARARARGRRLAAARAGAGRCSTPPRSLPRAGSVDATTCPATSPAYVVALVRATRTLPSVALGASPRAAVHLLAAAKARARLADREFVTPDDVAAIAPAVLRHRLVLTPEAELERFGPGDAVAAALASVPVPR